MTAGWSSGQSQGSWRGSELRHCSLSPVGCPEQIPTRRAKEDSLVEQQHLLLSSQLSLAVLPPSHLVQCEVLKRMVVVLLLRRTTANYRNGGG